MSKILYYLFLKPLSMLPLSILYVFSTGLYYVLYYGAGYRKKVVMGNLRRSFPDKSEEEIKKIASDFYRHLCDLIFESVRMFSMGKEEISRRAIVTNPEFVKELEAYNKGIVLIAGHYNSWEMMGTAFPMFSKLPVVALYSPIKDPFFSKVLSDSRGNTVWRWCPNTKPRRCLRNGMAARPFTSLAGTNHLPVVRKASGWIF